jgi:hypothetical protein
MDQDAMPNDRDRRENQRDGRKPDDPPSGRTGQSG